MGMSERLFLPVVVTATALATGLVVYSVEQGNTLGDQKTFEVENQFNGTFNAIDLRSVPGFKVNGDVGGGFLAFSGQINGETQSILQFAWETKGENPEIIISEIPMSEVIFVVTKNPNPQEYKGPTIKFTLDNNAVHDASWGAKQIDTSNPNNIIQYLRTVEFDMSQQDFDSFRGDANLGQ